MNCAQAQRAWMEQWDEEATSDGTRLLADHLARCPACEQETRALATLRETMRADPEPHAPPDLAARALAQCVVAPAPRATVRRWRWLPALSLAGVALVGSVVVFRPQGHPTTVRTKLSTGVATTAPVRMDARDAQALAAVGRAAQRVERAQMRAASALGRAIRLSQLGTKEEL
jgi:predicted anti-sigma-YlaC factor YlaD